jgi:acyl-CoA reductase-like NAD-dependent aldehyde dehydrogenase
MSGDDMKDREQFYLDGRWVTPEGRGVHEVIDAATEEVIATVPAGTAADADRAVRAAAAAFPVWSASPIEQRADVLERAAALLTERAEEIAALISREVGMPQHTAGPLQVGMAARDMSSMAQVVREFTWSESMDNAVVVREPIGVVAAITPWNFPLHQICSKVSAALAAGCTIVVKPSEIAPLTTFVFAEVMDGLGLPPGTFNLLTGDGEVVGEALAGHPLVDMVSFTGSVRAGRRVMELGAATIKRVTLELGGKAANILLDDCDFELAVARGVDDCFRNAGQVCSAPTRMLVPRARLEQVERLAVASAESYRLGDPGDPTTTLGPVVSATQRERVRSYIHAGVAEGARLLTGGPDAPEGLERGYFVRPTVFSRVANSMTIAREEIFGPVLSIIAYDSEEEAVRIANDSPYGLSGNVWSGDAERARAIAGALRVGKVTINGGGWTPLAPFGGYKQSGNGRELGRYGLEDYLEAKTLLSPAG